MFKKKIAVFIIFFLSLNAYGVHIYSVSPVDDSEWTFETTLGFQNITQMLMSQESGSNSQSYTALNFSGILFHSYYKKRLTGKAQLNLGFTEIPRFFWSDQPDFEHDDSLNEKLKCVEFDYQFYLPFISMYSFSILPFAGYSFVNYSYEPSFGQSYVNSFSYYSLSAGIQYFNRFSRAFSQTYFFSYSPMFLIQGLEVENAIHYFNYGAEFTVDTHPLAVTLFIIYRKAIKQSNIAEIFDETKYSFNTTEIGFSVHMNIR